MLRKVDPNCTFCNIFFQLATLKFVVWKVEHAVVIRGITSLTCNATLLCVKLNENQLPVLLGLNRPITHEENR